jgi:hypothetical protein
LDYFLTGGNNDFDPEYFDPEEVIFDDPQDRWSIAFEEE